jgi:hypothetical protein
MGYGRFKQNFSARPRKPVLVVNARASRPVIRFVGAVVELAAIEFLIAEIIAGVSSLRKKMSSIREFHSPAAAQANRTLRMIAIDRREA